MHIKLFQKTQSNKKKIRATPHANIYPIISQEPKYFWPETSAKGWTSCFKIFSGQKKTESQTWGRNGSKKQQSPRISLTRFFFETPHANIHPIISQEPKYSWPVTSAEGWTSCLIVFFLFLHSSHFTISRNSPWTTPLYRVTFLTGAPQNFLSTRSHVNWLGISLSARDCKGTCT